VAIGPAEIEWPMVRVSWGQVQCMSECTLFPTF